MEPIGVPAQLQLEQDSILEHQGQQMKHVEQFLKGIILIEARRTGPSLSVMPTSARRHWAKGTSYIEINVITVGLRPQCAHQRETTKPWVLFLRNSLNSSLQTRQSVDQDIGNFHMARILLQKKRQV